MDHESILRFVFQALIESNNYVANVWLDILQIQLIVILLVASIVLIKFFLFIVRAIFDDLTTYCEYGLDCICILCEIAIDN